MHRDVLRIVRALASTVFVIFAVTLLHRPALALWSKDGVQVCPYCPNPSYPAAVANDGAGSAVVVWGEYRRNQTVLLGQRINCFGNRVWPDTGLALSASPANTYPLSASTSRAGSVLVAWLELRQGRYVPVVQRFDSLGNRAWSSAVSVSGEPYFRNVFMMNVIADDNGGAFVVWIDSDTPNQYFVRAQHVSSDGSTWPTFKTLNPSLAVLQDASCAVMLDGEGGAIVVWNGGGCCAPVNTIAQRLDINGAALWQNGGVVVASGLPLSYSPLKGADDSAGGIVFAYARPLPSPNGYGDIRAVRIEKSNGMHSWAQEVAVCSDPGDQVDARVFPDGQGGTFVVWTDARAAVGGRDIYGQRITADGSGLWGSDGMAIASGPSEQFNPFLLPAGLSEPLVGWQGSGDNYFQRFDADGVVEWGAEGVPLGTYHSPNSICSDGAGGAYVVWTDQNVRVGWMRGSGSPAYYSTVTANLVGAVDTPRDQGGSLRLLVNAAPGDPAATEPRVTSYAVWRRVENGLGGAVVQSPQEFWDGKVALGAGALAVGLQGFPEGVWESIGAHPAIQSSNYTFLVPTRADSTEMGSGDETFVVTTHTKDPDVWTVSRAATGHSLDNLWPATPHGLLATYVSGPGVKVEWQPSAERDVIGYRIYRGDTPGFVPGVTNLLRSEPGIAYTDPAGFPGLCYKVAAMDRHGNESYFALAVADGPVSILAGLVSAEAQTDQVKLVWFTPSGSRMRAALFRQGPDGDHRLATSLVADTNGRLTYTDRAIRAGEAYTYWLVVTDGEVEVRAGEASVVVPSYTLRLRGVVPNPLAAGQSLRLRLEIASTSTVRAGLIDVMGRRLATSEATLGPGIHDVDLQTDGHLPPGVYGVRVEVGDQVFKAKAVVLK